MIDPDNIQRANWASGPTARSGISRRALDGVTAWMINEVGANRDDRSRHDALRSSEHVVLRQWRAGLGVLGKTELSDLVCTAHSIRDALRPEQLGMPRRLP